jgi:hypothetical protein
VVIYLNNILIYFKPRKDYYAYIKIVIKRLRKHKLYTELSKCFFNIKEVEFLGFIIGFINFYRRFIYRYSYKAIGLTNLLVGIKNKRKTSPFTFTLKAKTSFKKLKKAFTTALFLIYFDLNKLIHVETNALAYIITRAVS